MQEPFLDVVGYLQYDVGYGSRYRFSYVGLFGMTYVCAFSAGYVVVLLFRVSLMADK
jgi:hypothetical protein